MKSYCQNLGITVDRSCCHPFTGSSACPEEYGDFEVVITDTYTKYFTRCQGDLCNDGPGDNSDDSDNGGKFIFYDIYFQSFHIFAIKTNKRTYIFLYFF